jgi:hypothetical protein
MNPRLLLGGIKSYLPIPSNYKGTGGSVTGAYCYSVWLRHLTLIDRHVPGFRPRVVVELGPGDSIGLGLAALLSASDRYYGLDVVEHANSATNLRVLEELVELFRKREPIPGDDQFPRLNPRLGSYDFPTHLFSELEKRLTPEHVEQLRAALLNPGGSDNPIQFRCPWTPTSVAPSSADLVISQVALQDMDHLEDRDDLTRNVKAMADWLRPGGVMSHQIDFSCPGGTPWNHHWAYGDLPWRIVRGKRPYYVNRVPLTGYVRLFERAGCRVIGVEPVTRAGLAPETVASRFRTFSKEDFQTSAALIVAVKD